MPDAAEATIPYQPNDAGPETGPDPAGWAAAGAAANNAALANAKNPDRSQAGTEGATPGADFGKQQPMTQVQLVPHPIRPMRTGLLGVVDKIADALTGTDTPEIYTDGLGNKYVQNRYATRGEQWMRIAGTAVQGAAAGLAAGRGRGPGAAGVAGVQAGQQIGQARKQDVTDMTAEARQNNADRANALMANMNLIKESWEASRRQITASQQDMEFSQKQIDRLTKPTSQGGQGGEIIGKAGAVDDLDDVLHTTPDIAHALVKQGTVIPVNTVDEDGHKGVTFIRMPADSAKTIVPAGAEFYKWDPNKHEKTLQNTADPQTQGQINTWNTVADGQELAWRNQQDEHEKKQQDISESKAKTQATTEKLPLEKKLLTAEASEKNAQAKSANALADQRSGAGQPGAGAGAVQSVTTGKPAVDAELAKWPATTQQAVLALATYDADPQTFPPKNQVKNVGEIDRQTAVGLAKMIDPSFTEAKYRARRDALDDFTKPSGKAGGGIVALNTMIHHIGELNDAIGPLANMDNKLGNWANNAYRDMNSDPVITAFNVPKTGVEDEAATVFKATGATDTSIQNWGKQFSVNSGSKQQYKAVEEALKLAAGRMGALQGMFQRTMGRDPDFPFLDQDSVEILKKLPGGHELIDKQLKGIKPVGGQLRDVGVLGNMTTPEHLTSALHPEQQPQQKTPPARPANVPASAHWDWNANDGRGMWIP